MVALQLTELSCYSFLFGLIAKHDTEMKDKRIISFDVFRERKQRNLFSMNAQIFGCVTEIIFQLIIFVVRIMGGKFFPQYSDTIRSYFNLLFISQFALTSTLQILGSPELRKKFFAYFQN